MPELTHYSTVLSLKAVDTQQRIIEGYAAVFNNRDRTNDIIEPHAFDRTLASNGDVLVFLGHDASGLPLGEPLEMRADDKGLFTRTRIYKTQLGDDLLSVAKARMSAGKSLGMSIGYRPQQHRAGARTADGITRHLLDVDLVEYSFLASPDLAANPLAVTTNVKRRLHGKATVTTEGSYEDLQEDLEDAAEELLANDNVCVVATYSDHVIVCVREGEDEGGTYWDIPYKLDSDGEPVLGTPAPVDQAFVPAAAKAPEEPVTEEEKADWTTAYVNNLPDSAFAYIEGGGHKDEEGKTVPRSLRHYPHHDANGSVDLPHLRNALARAAANPGTGDQALAHLKRHAAAAGVGKDAPPADDAHNKEWQEGTIPASLVLQEHKLGELADDIATDQIAMSKLDLDTKAGRRISSEKLGRLREVISHLQEIVEWAEAVERGDDGKAQSDWYRTQADLFDLELEVA